jgi:uncharacterized protein YjbI with pentapeptide repeats
MRKVAQFLRGNATLLVFLALLAGGLWALISIPPREIGWIKKVDDVKREELENEARKTIIQVVGGAFAIFALFLTWRRVKVAEQGHITDRFTTAVEQLGKLDGDKPNFEIRLGGIYALERIALDSPRDHWTIMEVLTAYVRRNAPAPKEAPSLASAERPKPDIQAILNVLRRRRHDTNRERDGQYLDLGETDLRWADLRGASLKQVHLTRAYLRNASLKGANLKSALLFEAHLEAAEFDGAHMEEAILTGARMDWARLMGTHLQSAYLCGTNLQEADLSNTLLMRARLDQAHLWKARLQAAQIQGGHLEGANLREAHMERAALDGAHLEGAILVEAHLEDATGLTVAQVKAAYGWEQAYYSTELRKELGLPELTPDRVGGAGG